VKKIVKRHLGCINKVLVEGSIGGGTNRLSLATNAKIINNRIWPEDSNRYKIHITTESQGMEINGKTTNDLVFTVVGDWEMQDIVEMLKNAYKTIIKQK